MATVVAVGEDRRGFSECTGSRRTSVSISIGANVFAQRNSSHCEPYVNITTLCKIAMSSDVCPAIHCPSCKMVSVNGDINIFLLANNHPNQRSWR